MDDLHYFLFCAAFMLCLGLGLGSVFGYAEPASITVAQAAFNRSVVNQTATTVQAALEDRPDGGVVSPIVMVALLFVNNLVVAGLIAFNYRFLLPVQSIVITSGALFMNGFIAGAMLIREVGAGGLESIFPMLPYGGLEFLAFSVAGAIGYLARTDQAKRFAVGVLPPLVVGGLVEGMYLAACGL